MLSSGELGGYSTGELGGYSRGAPPGCRRATRLPTPCTHLVVQPHSLGAEVAVPPDLDACISMHSTELQTLSCADSIATV